MLAIYLVFQIISFCLLNFIREKIFNGQDVWRYIGPVRDINSIASDSCSSHAQFHKIFWCFVLHSANFKKEQNFSPAANTVTKGKLRCFNKVAPAGILKAWS